MALPSWMSKGLNFAKTAFQAVFPQSQAVSNTLNTYNSVMSSQQPKSQASPLTYNTAPPPAFTTNPTSTQQKAQAVVSGTALSLPQNATATQAVTPAVVGSGSYVLNPNTGLLEKKSSVNVAQPQPQFNVPDSIPADSLGNGARTPQSIESYPNVNPDEFVTGLRNATPALPTTVDPSTGKLNSLIDQYSATSDKMGTAGQRLSEVQQGLGIPEQQKQLQDLNLQIAQLSGAYDKGITDISGKPIPMQFITGQQAQMRMQKAAEIGALTSVQQALQGNIALAQQTAEQTINLEFYAQEQELKKLDSLIKYEYDNLSRADKLKADQISIQLEERQREIDARKDERASIMSLATQAAQNGAPSDLVRQIVASGNMELALEYSTPYLSSEMGGLSDTPSSFQEWSLAGGEQGTGKTYADWISSSSGKPLTQAQYTVANYASRLDQSTKIIDELENQFIGAASYIGEKLPNIMKSSDRQRFEQAQRNFINAVLRRESGAVISPEEFANARQQYFSQPGDSAEVLETKKANRDLVKRNFINEAGPAYNPSNQDPINLGFNQGGSGTPTATLNKVLSFKDGEKGGQCGQFVNKLTGYKLSLGDSYQSKISKMDKTIKYPEPGMVFVTPYKDTGHTGFVVAVNNDGTVVVRDSNYGLDEKIRTRTIPISKITGLARV